MPEMVDLPAFVGDDKIVRRSFHHVLENPEVADQDLVHSPQGLKDVEVMLAGVRFDVAALARKTRASGQAVFIRVLQYAGHGILRKPVDLNAGTICS